MATNGNERIFRELIDRAFCQGDTAAVDELMGPELVDHENGSPGRTGRDGVKWIITVLRAAFPDLVVTIEDLVVEGDKTWARVRYRGTNDGPFMGAAATGRSAEWDAVSICRYADSRVVEHWGVVDRLGGLQQLGRLQPHGAGAGQ